MENIIFDGKWSSTQEWKQSSYEYITIDGKEIHLKLAHYKEFIYVLVDAEDETSLNLGKDFAMICFDGKNNKSNIFDSNDFCFKLTLGSNSGETFQGNLTTNILSKISNHENLILFSSESGEHNRYDIKPHGVYEFRIPIELIDRSNNYGFFMILHDEQGKTYSWPDGIINSTNTIPPTNLWGEIISPDNTLPEFHFIPLILIGTILSVIILSRYRGHLSLFSSY